MSQDLAQRPPIGSATAESGPGPTPRPRDAAELPLAMDKDRRAGVERIIELSRWIVLVFAAVSNNFPTDPSGRFTSSVNLLLGGWGLFNLSATLALLSSHLPGRRTQLAMLALDISVASALVYLTGGYASHLGLSFYIVVIASSLRFGLVGSLICTTIVSGVYLIVSFLAGGAPFSRLLDTFTTNLFLFYVVALTGSLLARELVATRARQITHTFELEHAALAELREVDRIKSEFMMLASHELRTPLTKIKAWLMLMQDAGDRLPQSARDEGLQELRTEAEHLARLTDNLLCIAQLESGEIRIRSGAVEIDAVMRDVISRFVETADRGRFTVAIAPDATRVLADPDRLALVVACLVDNALKFSPAEQQVHISSERRDDRIILSVRDDGRRIPEDQVDRVFASFYQVESPLVRQRGGFGVGLYLSRQLLERMGGQIWIDNSRARGNTFVMSLPGHV